MTPSVSTPGLMNFFDALRKLAEGKRIARISWGNADYGVLKDGYVTVFHQKEGEKLADFHKWLINDGDLTADDFIVLPDLN